MADQTRGVAVVTGGAGNPVTALISERLAARGWQVAGLDSPAPDAPMSIEVDLSDRSAVSTACARISHELGPITLLVTGGLFYEIVPIDEVDPVRWQRMFDVHLGNVVNCCWAVVPEMLSAGSGTILLVSSEFAIDGTPEDWWAAHYAAAKGTIVGVARSLAAELAPQGIRVNSLAPGPTDLPHVPATDEYRQSLPLRRRLVPEESVDTALFIIEEGTYLVGQIISPNAGAVI